MVLAHSRTALAAALLLALVAGGAAAQLAPIDPAVAITLPSAPVDLGAGNSTTLNATVTNPGSFAGTVSLSIASLDGWTVTAEPSSFPLAAGASQDVVLTLVAPAAGAGAASGDVSVTATLADQAGRTATATGATPVTRVDPVIAPPPPPPYGLYALVAGVVVALVATGVALKVRDNRKKAAAAEAARVAAEKAAAEKAYLARETGITITLHDGPRPFGSKRELAYRLTVRNVSDRPRVGIVHVAELPAGWRASVALPKLPLSPGESALVSAYVAPDESVPAGTGARIVFLAKPEEAQDLDERVTLDVEAPLPHIPTSENADRPRSTHREPVAQRPALRK